MWARNAMQLVISFATIITVVHMLFVRLHLRDT